MWKFLRTEFRRLLDPPGLTASGQGLYNDRLVNSPQSLPPPLQQGEGLYLAKMNHRYLRFGGEAHLICFAPTGAGKGIGCVLPNLLTYPGSVIVLDLKGENYRLTHSVRRRMGQSVIRLDPFGIEGSGGDVLNPLDPLNPEDPSVADRAGVLAEALVVTNPQERDPHWAEKSKSLLKGLILFICTYAEPEDRHLGSIRHLLTAPPDQWEAYLQLLRESDLCGGLLPRVAAEVDRMGREERASVLSTMLRHTAFLESPAVIGSLSGKESFDLSRLTRERLSLYLLLPPPQIPAYHRLLRVWLSAILQALITRGTVSPDAPRILFLLDEVAQLGFLNELSQALTLYRGYGLQLWLFFQDLGQLKHIYPHEGWQSFLANCGVKQFFGINDLETAKFISESLGKTTVRTFNRSVSNGNNTNSGWSERERELLTAPEILTLPRDDLFLFLPGSPPVKAKRLDYRNDRF